MVTEVFTMQPLQMMQILNQINFKEGLHELVDLKLEMICGVRLYHS